MGSREGSCNWPPLYLHHVNHSLLHTGRPLQTRVLWAWVAGRGGGAQKRSVELGNQWNSWFWNRHLSSPRNSLEVFKWPVGHHDQGVASAITFIQSPSVIFILHTGIALKICSLISPPHFENTALNCPCPLTLHSNSCLSLLEKPSDIHWVPTELQALGHFLTYVISSISLYSWKSAHLLAHHSFITLIKSLFS